jgi:hypothetical protein
MATRGKILTRAYPNVPVPIIEDASSEALRLYYEFAKDGRIKKDEPFAFMRKTAKNKLLRVLRRSGARLVVPPRSSLSATNAASSLQNNLKESRERKTS